jgi:hypothetical protein
MGFLIAQLERMVGERPLARTESERPPPEVEAAIALAILEGAASFWMDQRKLPRE